jgi:hypothetical protein
MPRGDPVNGVGVVRDADAVLGQLLTKSYRPRAGYRRCGFQLGDQLGKLGRFVDGRLPDSLALVGVESGEDLAAEAVEHGKALALGTGLADPATERVESADAARRQAKRRPQPLRGGDADPDPGEGARTEPDRDQVDRFPATGGVGRRLDLGQQPGRMPGPPLSGEAQQRLVDDVAVAPGAGGRICGRGVETDYDQSAAPEARCGLSTHTDAAPCRRWIATLGLAGSNHYPLRP